PLLISMPHTGTAIPPYIASQLTPAALNMPDVDWHLPALYNMAQACGASVIAAETMRYVIDLNRPPEDSNLYPGQDTTGLCPLDTFAKQPVYETGTLPDASEIQSRIARYWQPYHDQLQRELDRILALHGVAVLWDAHSIASQVPRFFAGRLPDLNFGTADGKSCAASLQDALAATVHDSMHAATYSHVFNGRFKGGYITRHYGRPERNIHAVQLEISQRTYMQETWPYTYEPGLAQHLQPLLRELLECCKAWASQNRQGQALLD
ncbi:MAG TPA: N-formylglutamate deformylase, partial [Methylophilaceae bacterium]|nr:N-formylglutamate deformylase [Methylophilaceae bacterium]